LPLGASSHELGNNACAIKQRCDFRDFKVSRDAPVLKSLFRSCHRRPLIGHLRKREKAPGPDPGLSPIVQATLIAVIEKQ